MSFDISKASDQELVRDVYEGNTLAFGELYNRYLDEIYRYVYYRAAKNHQETEDLTQEVFIKAWDVISRNKPKSEDDNNFRALVYRIAHNTTIDRWRTLKQILPLSEEVLTSLAGDQTSPESRMVIQEESQELAEAVNQLSPRLQEVFICRFINGLSHAETAESLGLKEGHVRVLQHRALKKIRITSL